MKKLPLAVLCLLAVPALADIGHDITIPIAGRIEVGEVTYRTELVIRNHRDVRQPVLFEFIGGGIPRGPFAYDGMATLEPRETLFDQNGRVPNSGNQVFALRLWAGRPTGQTDSNGSPLFEPDADAKIEAVAYIVRDVGRFAYKGSSRQEMTAIASTEYFAKETTFYGLRHDGIAYTNLGITNMHDTETVTFIVEFPYLEPFEVAVPPRTLQQIRIPGNGNAGRSVRVIPSWAKSGGTPTPWVAYTSTLDTQTGDAYSGIRSLAKP